MSDLLSSQKKSLGSITASYNKPPIPADILSLLNPTNVREYPRWYPTIGMLRAYEQDERSLAYMHPQDAQSTYQYASILSGGLESGQQRDYRQPVPDDVKVLFWQKQVCHCKHATSSSGAHDDSTSTAEASSSAKGVCKPGYGCTPFYIILQEKWQRDWADTNPIRVLFMDETHHLNEV